MLRNAPTGRLEKSIHLAGARSLEMTLMRQFIDQALAVRAKRLCSAGVNIEALGVPVILLSWDFEYMNDDKHHRYTNLTSVDQ